MEAILLMTITFPIVLVGGALSGILLSKWFFMKGHTVGRIEERREIFAGMAPTARSTAEQAKEVMPQPEPKVKKGPDYDPEDVGAVVPETGVGEG